jgi:FixJ family two-component response regulator
MIKKVLLDFLYSGEIGQLVKSESMKAGADDFLEKPTPIEHLHSLLKPLFEMKK